MVSVGCLSSCLSSCLLNRPTLFAALHGTNFGEYPSTLRHHLLWLMPCSKLGGPSWSFSVLMHLWKGNQVRLTMSSIRPLCLILVTSCDVPMQWEVPLSSSTHCRFHSWMVTFSRVQENRIHRDEARATQASRPVWRCDPGYSQGAMMLYVPQRINVGMSIKAARLNHMMASKYGHTRNCRAIFRPKSCSSLLLHSLPF